jgi:hypothetical protein
MLSGSAITSTNRSTSSDVIPWPMRSTLTEAAQGTQGVRGEVAHPAASTQDLIERLCDPDDQLVVRASRSIVRTSRVSKSSTRSSPPGANASTSRLSTLQALSKVLQHQSLMDHVPRAFRDGLRNKVHGAHLQLGTAVGSAPTRVGVDRQHAPRWPDLVGHPSGDRTAPRTDLQAAEPPCHPQTGQVTSGHRIEHDLQAGKAISGLGLGVRQQVRRRVISHPRALPPRSPLRP